MEEWKMKGKPALIIIHMQHAIATEEGAFARFGHAKATKEAGIIPYQQALLKGFREKKLPVIFVVAESHFESGVPPYGAFWKVLDTVHGNLPGSKDVEVIPELAPRAGEPVIGNWRISSFANSNLDELLKDFGVETVVLTGIATDIAVLTTAIDATDHGYAVIVPKDASTGANKRAHELVMNEMLPGMSLVTTTKDVLAHL